MYGEEISDPITRKFGFLSKCTIYREMKKVAKWPSDVFFQEYFFDGVFKIFFNQLSRNGAYKEEHVSYKC